MAAKKETAASGVAMKRAFAIGVIAELCVAMLVLQSEIKDFIWTHPWWHSFLVLIPAIAVPVLAVLELSHLKEANRLLAENLRVSEEANGLRSQQTRHIASIAELQGEIIKLQAERNTALGKIAVNTQKVPTEAENNAAILRKYIGKCAQVTEGSSSWGGMGAIIADVNDNNILTLFVPSSFSSSHSFGQCVRCDKLHIVEAAVGSCPVQIHIVERYGSPTSYGEAKSWEERNVVSGTLHVRRGNNVFNANYRKDGTSKKRGIYVYSSTDGSPNYSLVTFEDMKESASWYCEKIDVEKKFAVLQIEWLNAGWRNDGGGGGNSLFLYTKP
jgi:hypothetical protein